jgi:hypothetical protein
VARIKPAARQLTYANVVATIALILSLGGASYAAIELPSNSVGARQLRHGAVTPNALAFPLGATSVTDNREQDLTKGACNSPLAPGEIPPPCAAPILGGTTPGRQVRVSLPSSGQLLISATAGLRNGGAPSTTADITYAVIVDGRAVAQRVLTFSGGQQIQAPIQGLVNVRAGSHVVGFGVLANYSSNGPGDAFVAPVSVIVSALPAERH